MSEPPSKIKKLMPLYQKAWYHFLMARVAKNLKDNKSYRKHGKKCRDLILCMQDIIDG